MNIAIYGNDRLNEQQVVSVIRDYTNTVFMKTNIDCFHESDKLFNAMDQGDDVDVVFLEIASNLEECIMIASIINEKYHRSQVVFYSEDLQNAKDVYGTAHTYFVLKEELHKRIEEIFRRILYEQREKRKRILLSVIGGTKRILSPEEIIYFERSKRITRVVSIHGVYEIRDKLDDIMNMVSQKDFFRCHNSYIIGIAAVKEITKNYFVMINGDSVVISRSYKKFADKMFW